MIILLHWPHEQVRIKLLRLLTGYKQVVSDCQQAHEPLSIVIKQNHREMDTRRPRMTTQIGIGKSVVSYWAYEYLCGLIAGR